MTVLVTGATGFLGASVVAEVTSRGMDVVGLSSWDVDIVDGAAVRATIDGAAPEAVIHLAAQNPGRGDPTTMLAVNGEGAANVARAARSVGARLVHVSSDVVHDGTAGPYGDDAAPSAASGYGGAKAAGELAVARADPTASIVRTSLLWDPARLDRSTAAMADRLAGGQALTLWEDCLRQPITTRALARVLVELAITATDVAGTINVAGRDVIDRATFTCALLAHFGLADPVEDRSAGRLVFGPTPDGVPRDLRLRLDRCVDRWDTGGWARDQNGLRHGGPERSPASRSRRSHVSWADSVEIVRNE